MSQSLVRIEDLTISYRTRDRGLADIIRHVYLDIGQGQALGLVGESGCGKTTLGLAVLGFLRPGARLWSGTVSFGEVNVFSLTSKELENLRGKRIALIPQNTGQSLTPTMRVGAQIEEVLTLHRNMGQKEAHERAVLLLGKVRLPQPEEMFARYPHELSGGQVQRVAIAMALACEPELLILDEPTTGLDVTTQAHILTLLRDIQTQMGMAMLYISHDLGAVARVSDRVAVMYAGQVVEDGLATRVFGQPTHPYTRGLLASIPRLSESNLPQAMPGRPPAPGEHTEGCPFLARCPFGDSTCAEIDPPMTSINENGDAPHKVRCHHWQRALETVASLGKQLFRRRSRYTARKEPFIQLEDVDITYSKRGIGTLLQRLRGAYNAPPNTVSGINLTVHRGETLALVGESGSGKSTIARTIAGLLAPCAGQIRMEDHDLASIVEKRSLDVQHHIQMVFQNPDASLNPRHTVRQILDMPLRLYFKLRGEQRLQRSTTALEEVQLSALYIHRFPGQMSGGEKQRIAVARAFVAEPEVVLCDEVTSALDVSVQAAILNLLADLQADQGVAYLFISHDLAVVRSIADRVAVLYQGRLCEVAPVDRIYAPPYHPYTETLLAAVPEPIPGVQPRLLAKDVKESEPPPQGCPFQRRCPRWQGPVCDEETPPWQAVAEEHFIGCHIPAEELCVDQMSLIPTASPN